MLKSKESINLETKFKMAEYDFNENIHKAAAPKNNESIVKVVKNFAAHMGIFFHAVSLWVLFQVKQALNHAIVFFKEMSFKINRKREKSEVRTEEFVKLSMERIEETIVEEQIIDKKNDEVQAEFAVMLNATFSEDVVCTSTINCSSEHNEAIRESIEYAVEILRFINSKLTEARLTSNLNFVEINYRPKVEEKKVIFTVKYDLIQKGSVWSNIFAAFIMKKLSLGLKGPGGTALAVYQFNTTLNIETFTLTIGHDLIAEKNNFLAAKETQLLSERVEQLSM